MSLSFLDRPGRPRLAYDALRPAPQVMQMPALVFLEGFRSDMEGNKAVYLREQCRERGQGFLRFDYSGHGKSGGNFRDLTLGDWVQDSLDIIDFYVARHKIPLVLAGSSMGGWIALLVALKRPQIVKGIVGIATAPDFTHEIYENRLSHEQREQMNLNGFIEIESDYSAEPYIITKKLIEEGRDHALLNKEVHYPCPLRLIQGMKDPDVPWQTAWKIRNAASKNSDIHVMLVENGDHRLSAPSDLAMIDEQVRLLSDNSQNRTASLP